MEQILEVLAIILALLYVFWAAKGNLLCWPAAFLSSGIYVYLCFKAQLYPETLLQIFYLLFAIYGWKRWKITDNINTTKGKDYRKISGNTLSMVILIGLLFSFSIAWYFDNFTKAALPYLDAPILVFSLLATWLVAEKIIENWYFWMVIDLAAAYLYYARAMELTAILYLFYVLLAIWGLQQWKKNLS